MQPSTKCASRNRNCGTTWTKQRRVCESAKKPICEPESKLKCAPSTTLEDWLSWNHNAVRLKPRCSSALTKKLPCGRKSMRCARPSRNNRNKSKTSKLLYKEGQRTARV